jgi:SRSO17 transposase
VALGLTNLLSPFSPLFQTKTHQVSDKALCYIRGLFKSEKNRANCTAIADSLGELDHQSLNHLLSESPWDYREVLEEISVKVDQMFAHKEETALLIDEVGFRKKGKSSACVGRQYLGCLGKQDNGQVAVVSGLSSENHYCPVDIRLFMPKNWENDKARREKAKIPDYIRHQTKPQMALRMIQDLKARGIHFNYVGFDALYGSSFELIETIDEEQISFIGDVKDNVQVYTSRPNFFIPEKQEGKRGRSPLRYKTDMNSISLRTYKEKLSNDDFELITFRDGTKQKIKAYFHQKEIWICTDSEKGITLRLQLIIRKDLDGTVKYSFCNMHDCPLLQIARRQGQRVFVERIFEEGKNQIGMGDYQVRSWAGFHKHMTLCFLAFYYIASQKLMYENDFPFTAPVIRKLVASTIVSKWESLDATIELCLQHVMHYHRKTQRNLREDWVT